MTGTPPEPQGRSSGVTGRRPRLSGRTIAKMVGIAVVVFVVVPVIFVYTILARSKPVIDGRLSAPGLTGAVTITRDSLGVPTIVATNRADLAYATGFVHAQDRFFQMDLSRRLPAGELSALFGRIAVEQDRAARVFRFREVARAVLAQASDEQRASIEAYARGVNAGLASLGARPWEYFALQVTPAPWTPEDVVLIPYAMWWDLQRSSIEREKLRRAVNLRLGGEVCADGWKCAMPFFYPRGTSWDSPNSATGTAEIPAIRLPTPDELNLRASTPPTSRSEGDSRVSANQNWFLPSSLPERPTAIGSNGWVLGGAQTKGGGALVASDMHLGLRIPAVWYRARLQLKPSGADAPTLDLNGLMLPGAHVLVAGSNGHIAWGFTNAYGDWADVTFAPCTTVDDSSLRAGSETIPLTTVQEKIVVKGERSDVTLPVRTGPDGLLVETDLDRGRCWFARWIATLPGATNFNLMAFETATTVAQAIDIAPTIGIPHQNLMVGDREGHVGWTIIGRLPDTADAKLRLTGEAPWTTAANHPRLIDPPAGRVWSANARSIDDPVAEALIGGDEAAIGGDYDLSARAHQIRDGLAALKSPATPADMLAIQLDDRALFLARWQALLLKVLDDEAVRDHAERAELKRLVSDWNARATTDSVGYRLVRAFHSQTELAVWGSMLDRLEIDAPAARARAPSQFEGALWELVTQQPLHLLAPSYPSWKEFLLAQADETVRTLTTETEPGAGVPCPKLDRCTWGSRRPVLVRHPMSGSVPLVGGLLNMPVVEIPGDHDMPRVQDGAFGASERFAVVPGRESEGYLHIPGGQSGHPLSPFYRAGFSEWAEGKPLPFLPGPAEHTLTLAP